MFVNKSIFWFEKRDDGQDLVNAAGQRFHFTEKHEDFNKNEQLLDSWQRAMLYIKYNDIWDVTAFACGMDTPIGVGPIQKTKRENPCIFVFFYTAVGRKTSLSKAKR